MLQKQHEGSNHDENPKDKERPEGKPKEERERKKRGEKERDDEGGVASKPSGNLSLFDFVQNKLPFQNGKQFLCNRIVFQTRPALFSKYLQTNKIFF